MENGVKTCANILDQDNKMNSTRAQDYYNSKVKRRKNVVCQDTVKVPSPSALESLQEVIFCQILMTHINSHFLIRKTLNSSKALISFTVWNGTNGEIGASVNVTVLTNKAHAPEVTAIRLDIVLLSFVIFLFQERIRHCSVTSVKMETEKRKCSDKTCNKVFENNIQIKIFPSLIIDV